MFKFSICEAVTEAIERDQGETKIEIDIEEGEPTGMFLFASDVLILAQTIILSFCLCFFDMFFFSCSFVAIIH